MGKGKHPEAEGGRGGGQREETGGAKGLRRIEMGAGERRPPDGTERERTREGARRAQWGLQCCISGGGAKL